MDQNTVWLIAGAALAVGVLLGFMFGRSGAGGSREMELANELERSQHELSRYRDQVNEHFSTTADLINGLSQQYQKVHQHLASSAEQLCRDEKLVNSLQLSAAGVGLPAAEAAPAAAKAESPEAESSAEDVRAPLDYAPSRAKDEPGTLSDRFGLQTATAEAQPPGDPSSADPENPGSQKA